MERENDAQLIQDTLAGNDEAFNALVRKYQKRVHALAWRKIGDFQDAEEVTQDTFLQALYKNLSTLKNPHQFAGWLYVIANQALSQLDSKTEICHTILRGHAHERNRECVVYTL